MAGKSPQSSHEPPVQAEGTLRADACQIGEGLRAGGSPGPELPKSRGALQNQLGKEKDTQEIPVK